MNSIVLAGGGTAGHVTPHLALLPYLQKHFNKIYYVSSGKEIEKMLFKDTPVQIFTISPPPLKRSLTPKNLLIPLKLVKAVKECKAFLQKTKPKVVFSKGGYCALPVCIACKSLNIPLVCHESDLTMGLANRLSYKNATLLTTFNQTALKYGGVCVGAPLREELNSVSKSQAINLLKIKNDKPILLVTGGSQGSSLINNAVWHNLNALLTHFNVIHLYGKSNKCPYSAINGYYPFAFTNVSLCFSACDLCISRGGANTLFELLYCQVPSLIIPLKKGSRGDQIKNANYFFLKGAVLTANENDFKENPLSYALELYKNKERLQNNAKKLNVQNATPKIAKILTDFCKK